MKGEKLPLKLFGLVILAAFLVFFAHMRSFQLLFDGLTYTALAKHILSTGDWRTLHYGVEQYPDFFQHPPFAIWIQAILINALGTAEWVTRVLPSSCALLTFAGVYLFAYRRSGTTAAFLSSIVLLTSTRYIKWGSNFYLDGILGCFAFLGFGLWLTAITESRRPYRIITSFCAGLFFAFAFMTKGVVVAAPFGVALLAVAFYLNPINLMRLAVLLVGFAVPLLMWFKLGDGYHYLEQYLQLSVKGRAGGGFTLSPVINLVKVWWPWWPVFIYAGFSASKHFKLDRTQILWWFAALAFVVGFTSGSGYLEHYLTPFYPFAALAIGTALARIKKFEVTENTAQGFSIAILGLAVFLATVAPDVNAQKETPAMKWLHEISKLPLSAQRSIQEVDFTDQAGDLWMSLATILGRTPYQSIGAFDLNRPARPSSILITAAGEKPASSWFKAECLTLPGWQFYVPAGEKICDVMK